MAVLLKWKTCMKCGYTGNMDCWTDEKLGKVCSCPVCRTKFIEKTDEISKESVGIINILKI